LFFSANVSQLPVKLLSYKKIRQNYGFCYILGPYLSDRSFRVSSLSTEAFMLPCHQEYSPIAREVAAVKHIPITALIVLERQTHLINWIGKGFIFSIKW